ncbi:MAG: CHAT domain-containing tetratricopeptide repeat protein, partial [Bacteroidota bacterium]
MLKPMRTIVLLLLNILLLPIGYSQNLDSTEIENRFQQILPLEQAAYYDSAAQAYRQLRTQLRQQKSLDASHRATYKIGYCLIRAGQRAEAIDSLTTGIGQMLQHEDSSYLYIVSAYNELGTASWLLGDISQAGQYYQKSLTLALKAKPPLAARIKVARFNIALIRMRQGYYQEAINSFQTMIADLQQNQPTRNDSLTIANAWINIASAYNSLGNYTRSLEYNRLGLEAHRNYYGDDHPQIGNDLTNIGHILEILKRHDEALPYHKQALQIQQARLGDDHPTLGNTYLNLGASYEGLKQYDSSLYYYDKAYQIYLATRESDDYDLRLALNNLGGIAYEQQDYLQAANYHRQSIQRTGPNAYEEIYGEALYALGADLWALGQIDSGRYYIEAGLAELRKSSPDGALINSVFKASILQGYTTYAGSIWHQEERHEEASLDEILSLVDSGQQVLYGARLSDIDAASRYAMRVNGFNLLSISLEASYARHQLSTSAEVVDQAFRFAEREKSASLYDQLKRTDALQFAGISPESQAKEEAVRNRLAHLREQLYYSLSSDEVEVLLQLRADIEATKREYDVLLKKLEQDYSQYFFLQQGEQDISLSAVQERLSPKDAMLVFTVLDSSIMLWVIQAGQVDFQRLAKPVDLSQQITNFRALAERPSTPLADYLSLASPLYEALLRPGLAKLPPDVQNLILIPDAELSLLPFEVLTASPNASSYQDADYLFQQYAVSYAYSAAVYLEQTKPKAPSYESLFAGFAANYEVPQWSELDSAALLGELVRSGELPLPAARQEVIDIAGLMGGQAFLDDDASEQSFREKAVDYAILHLAMHTLLDDRDPMFSKLVFSPSADTAADGLLTAAELYNLRLPSQLTVLSACNTGFGKIIEGEGVMSLSRAFSYAGCPSTLMSLWKVPDNATRQLMLAFYQGLKDGKSKNEALREAKIQYLQSVKTSEQAHPFYWAGFVQMGNPAPLQTKSWWQHLEAGLIAFGDYAWGYPLLIILMGGGLF